VPAIPSCLLEPIWEQFQALLPERDVQHPLGCHRPRVPDRVVFDKLVQVLVFGCAYWRVADTTCSASTLRRRRDEWIKAGVMDRLEAVVRDGYDRLIGLQLGDLCVDGCITKAPCGGERAGRSPVDRGKQGTKRSVVVDAAGIPLGVVSAPASAHDSPLLAPTLDLLKRLDPLPDAVTVHLDAGYDSTKTRTELADRGLCAVIATKGRPAPIQVGQRWVVERTNAWHNAHRKLLVCTERRARVIDFWIALANAIITTRRLLRAAWTMYRWNTRPRRRP
jgi:transposase